MRGGRKTQRNKLTFVFVKRERDISDGVERRLTVDE